MPSLEAFASLPRRADHGAYAANFGAAARHLPSMQPIIAALLGAVPVRIGSQIIAGVGVSGGSGEKDRVIAELPARTLSVFLQRD